MRALSAKALIYFCSLLPLRLNHAFARLLAQVLWLFPSKLKQVTLTNIRICFPDKDEQQAHRLAKEGFIETIKTATETGALWLWRGERVLSLVRAVDNESLLKDGFNKGNGVILALPHLGAWELIGVYGSKHYAMTSLYRPPRLPQLDLLIKNARQRMGATLVPTNAKGIRALYTALKHNELVAILPDQEPDKNGVFAPFFGTPAYTMTLLTKLATKTGATVLFAYARRLEHGRGFRLVFKEAAREISQPDLEVSTRYLNEGIEACVREVPEQYQWTYKRFKTRPDKARRFY